MVLDVLIKNENLNICGTGGKELTRLELLNFASMHYENTSARSSNVLASCGL